jgi:hypothetical protein
MAGGGGGGGYYGGGGGAANNKGAGGGGGSGYANSTYVTTTASDNGSYGNAGKDDDSDWANNAGEGGHTSSPNGKNGRIVPNITVTAPAPGANLTLVSQTTAAAVNPTKGDLVTLIENTSGTATVNTDIKGYISRDGGTNWTQGTLVDEGSWGTNKKVLAFHDLDISGQPAAANMRYKIETLNQSNGSKVTKIHATSLGWR